MNTGIRIDKLRASALTVFGLAVAVGFMLACGPSAQYKPMYNWGEYSASLYNLKKTPNDEALKKHKETLMKIIEQSKENGLRVPPGIYCEYANILIKEGKNKEALPYLELEEQTYPESSVFVQRLKSHANKTKEGQ